MTRLSKEDRKRLRREAEQSIRHQDVFVAVVSPRATVDAAGPAHIIAEAAKVGVVLGHRRVDDKTHVFGVPGELDTLHVVMGYGFLDGDVLSLLNSSEWLDIDQHRLVIGSPAIRARAKVFLDPAIDFVAMTVMRVLGRLTQGTLISPDGSVYSDWLAWSLDYMDPDMFNVTRVYDDPPPDFRSLADRFPQLRPARLTKARKNGPWWKIW